MRGMTGSNSWMAWECITAHETEMACSFLHKENLVYSMNWTSASIAHTQFIVQRSNICTIFAKPVAKHMRTVITEAQ